MHRLDVRLARLEKSQSIRRDSRIEQLKRVAGKTRYQALSDLAEVFRIYLARPHASPKVRILLTQKLETVESLMVEEKSRLVECEGAENRSR